MRIRHKKCIKMLSSYVKYMCISAPCMYCTVWYGTSPYKLTGYHHLTTLPQQYSTWSWCGPGVVHAAVKLCSVGSCGKLRTHLLAAHDLGAGGWCSCISVLCSCLPDDPSPGSPLPGCGRVVSMQLCTV